MTAIALLAGVTTALSVASRKQTTPTASLNFHQVLQKVGKTCFRPGGSKATATLHEWADLPTQDTALKLAAGLGTGGMNLATKYGCKVLLTDRDEDRLAQAAKVASQNSAVSHLVTMQYLDILSMEESLPTVGATIVEASLTHFSTAQKTHILSQLQPHTKQVLLHEICLVEDTATSHERATAVKHDLGQALQIGFHPETASDWVQILADSGFTVEQIETGPIQLLNPMTLVEDEGLSGAMTMAWNLVIHPDLRERVLCIRQLLHTHRHSLHHILLQAVPTLRER